MCSLKTPGRVMRAMARRRGSGRSKHVPQGGGRAVVCGEEPWWGLTKHVLSWYLLSLRPSATWEKPMQPTEEAERWVPHGVLAVGMAPEVGQARSEG